MTFYKSGETVYGLVLAYDCSVSSCFYMNRNSNKRFRFFTIRIKINWCSDKGTETDQSLISLSNNCSFRFKSGIFVALHCFVWFYTEYQLMMTQKRTDLKFNSTNMIGWSRSSQNLIGLPIAADERAVKEGERIVNEQNIEKIFLIEHELLWPYLLHTNQVFVNCFTVLLEQALCSSSVRCSWKDMYFVKIAL